MHERTQRAIARLLFVACCAVPTAITILCVLTTWTPWYHQRVLRQLETKVSQFTGMIVRIEDFHRVAPETIQLSRVRVVNPETLREVAEISELEWAAKKGRVTIDLHWPKLQAGQLESAWQLVHDRFLCDPNRTLVPVHFTAKDLTIQSELGAMTWQEIDAWLKPDGKTVTANVQCLLAGNAASPIQVKVNRDRRVDPPVTRWLLDSGSTPLPCTVLAEYLPVLESLGPDAHFSGTIRWQSNARGWMVDLGGSRFDQVAMDRLFENQHHRLTGMATISFTHCHINPGESRSDVVGSIRVVDGHIGRSLLRSAGRSFGFETGLPDGVNDVPFDRLCVGFNINNDQLLLQGICQTEPGYEGLGPSVVMSMDGQPLVRSTDQHLYAIDAMHLIAPEHAIDVPLAGQNGWLAKVIIPPSRPIPGSENRIRAARRYNGGPVIEQPVNR